MWDLARTRYLTSLNFPISKIGIRVVSTSRVMKRVPRDKEIARVKSLVCGKNSANVSYLFCQCPSLSLILASCLNFKMTFVTSHCVCLLVSHHILAIRFVKHFKENFPLHFYFSRWILLLIFAGPTARVQLEAVCHISTFLKSINPPISY